MKASGLQQCLCRSGGLRVFRGGCCRWKISSQQRISASRTVPQQRNPCGCTWATIKSPSDFSGLSHTCSPPFPISWMSRGKIHQCQKFAPLQNSSGSLCFHPHGSKASAPPRQGSSKLHHMVVMGKKCYSWQSFPGCGFFGVFFLMLNCSFSDFESQYFSKRKATSLEKIQLIPSKFFAITSA